MSDKYRPRLIEELILQSGQRPSSRITEATRLAAGAQRQRQQAGDSHRQGITRTVLLWALMSVDPGIEQALAMAGVGRSELAEVLTLDGSTAPDEHADATAEPELADALDEYLKSIPLDVEVGTVDLAVAILISAQRGSVGRLTGRLAQLQVDYSKALAALTQLGAYAPAESQASSSPVGTPAGPPAAESGNVVEQVLGEAGEVSCSAVITSRPWQLDIEALVVSAGPNGVGQLGKALRENVAGIAWTAADLPSLSPERPQVLPVSASTDAPTLRWIILGCARETDNQRPDTDLGAPGTADAVGRAVVAAVRTAAGRRVESLAIPLLGAGAIGLRLEAMALANVGAVRRALADAAPSSLRRIIFVGQDQRTLDAIRTAWKESEPAALQEAPTAPSDTGQQPAPVPAAQDSPPEKPGRLSPAAAGVLAQATFLAGAGGTPDAEPDPSFLLLSVLTAGRGGGNGTAGRLLRRLLGDRDEEKILAGLASALNVPIEATFAEPPGTDGTPVADSAVLRLAQTLATRLGAPPLIEIRHVLAAVATSPGALPSGVLDALAVSPYGLRRALRQTIAEELPDEVPDRWDEVLGVITEATRLAGGISRDLVDAGERIPLADDHLGLGTYVTMLATIIAGRHTPLPLSVGLFGEWGSGKSFFMGLLRDRIDKLAASGDEAYLADIVPITFNAWHYADTNLWASLGNEIFEQLAGPRATAAQRRGMLREELADKLQHAQELKLANDQAERETARLGQELEQARKKAAGSAVTLARSVAGSPTLKKELKKDLEKVWRRLGVHDVADQSQLLAGEIRQSGTEVNALKLVVTGRWGRIAAWLAAMALALLAGLLFFTDVDARGLAGGGLASLVALLAGMTAGVGRVRAGLVSLRKVAYEIREQIETETDKKVAENLQQLRLADAREAVLQSQITEVLQRAGELGRELAALSPGQQWYGFVSERAGSEEYRRELGLISTIRRDFEHLIELMKDWRSLEEPDERHRPIDRIVLYIDDLDRCSPRQVVDVLQAVHLLLALDLFVVVVGVDPRWLLHSLREQYSAMFRGREDGDPSANPDRTDEEAVWRTTPHDYLEKIFNIPFVLPGMTGASFGNLIRELSQPENAHDPDGDRRRKVEVDPDVPPSPQGTGGNEVPANDAAPLPETPGVPAPAPVTDLRAETGSEVAAALGVGAKTVPLRLTEDELKLLAALGPLVRSPRQAKRLLNLYRMVRSTRDLSPASAFLGGESVPGQFEAVGVLLGLLTTYPRLLGQLIGAPPGEHTPGGLCSRPPAQSWQEAVEGLRPRSSDGRWSNDVSDDLSDADRREWAELVRRIGPATALVTLPDLTAFRLWGPRVTRFSFTLSPFAAQEAQEDDIPKAGA